jgi:hypothetical protein
MKIDFDDAKINEVKALLADIKNGAEWALSKAINAAITTTKSQAIKKTAEIIIEYKEESRKHNKDKEIIALFLGGKSMLNSKKTLEVNNIRCFNDFQNFKFRVRSH